MQVTVGGTGAPTGSLRRLCQVHAVNWRSGAGTGSLSSRLPWICPVGRRVRHPTRVARCVGRDVAKIVAVAAQEPKSKVDVKVSGGGWGEIVARGLRGGSPLRDFRPERVEKGVPQEKRYDSTSECGMLSRRKIPTESKYRAFVIVDTKFLRTSVDVGVRVTDSFDGCRISSQTQKRTTRNSGAGFCRLLSLSYVPHSIPFSVFVCM